MKRRFTNIVLSALTLPTIASSNLFQFADSSGAQILGTITAVLRCKAFLDYRDYKSILCVKRSDVFTASVEKALLLNGIFKKGLIPVQI